MLEKKLAKMQGNLDTAELIIKEQQQQMNISKEQQHQQQQLNDKKVNFRSFPILFLKLNNK